MAAALPINSYSGTVKSTRLNLNGQPMPQREGHTEASSASRVLQFRLGLELEASAFDPMSQTARGFGWLNHR
jgi:hypothetical protein